MKGHKNINMKMYLVDDAMLPFVVITFMGLDSKMHSALMLMDSGSSINTLMTEMRVLVGKEDWLLEESDEVVTVTNGATKVPCGNFQFELDGESFREKFFFFENQHLMQIGDMMFVGVLGNRFMQKHHIAIDYANMTVHTSEMALEQLTNRQCNFVIPMEYGLRYYNVPILNIQGKNADAFIFADTGCDNFSISQNAIEKCCLTYKLTGNILPVNGPNGSIDAKECLLDFQIADNIGNIVMQSYQEPVEILPYSLNVTEDGECDDEGKLLSPIEGMIGSPFMAREKWVLDFSIKAIYRL